MTNRKVHIFIFIISLSWCAVLSQTSIKQFSCVSMKVDSISIKIKCYVDSTLNFEGLLYMSNDTLYFRPDNLTLGQGKFFINKNDSIIKLNSPTYIFGTVFPSVCKPLSLNFYYKSLDETLREANSTLFPVLQIESLSYLTEKKERIFRIIHKSCDPHDHDGVFAERIFYINMSGGMISLQEVRFLQKDEPYFSYDTLK